MRAITVAQERRLAELRQDRLLRRARTDHERLAAADRAFQEGDLDVACLIYVRLALSRPPSAVSQEAKKILTQLQEQARQELRRVDVMLTDESSGAPPIPALVPVDANGQVDLRWQERVAVAFQNYEQLGQKYGRVPVVGEEIARHIAKQRRRPAYAAVLNEAEAKTLWQLGQQYESRGHGCCAYLVYEEAARLMPAPSARLAHERFSRLKEDSRIVASLATCRELQWCHEAYLRAEQWSATKPERARALLEEIVRRAPEDSDVHHAARQQLESSGGSRRPKG